MTMYRIMIYKQNGDEHGHSHGSKDKELIRSYGKEFVQRYKDHTIMIQQKVEETWEDYDFIEDF